MLKMQHHYTHSRLVILKISSISKIMVCKMRSNFLNMSMTSFFKQRKYQKRNDHTVCSQVWWGYNLNTQIEKYAKSPTNTGCKSNKK